MHPSAIFQTDAEAARTIVREHPLATLAVNGREGPVIAIVPLVWNADDTILIGHVAKSNAFWTELDGASADVSAVFRADDAYVSASAYPSKADHGRVVPTWNYIAAEVRGRLTFSTDLDDVRASVSALSDQMEQARSQPWSVDDAPDAYIDKLANAIVAFEIQVSELKGVRKLSQNKSETDRGGVMADLAQRDDRHSSLSDEMRKAVR